MLFSDTVGVPVNQQLRKIHKQLQLYFGLSDKGLPSEAASKLRADGRCMIGLLVLHSKS